MIKSSKLNSLKNWRGLGVLIFLLFSASLFAADTVHYWDLNEISGSTYRDSPTGTTATDANCTGTSCPDPVSGIASGAQNFNVSKVDVNDTAAFDWAKDDDFTIEFWMKSDNQGSNNMVLIGRDSQDGGSTLHWWIGIQGHDGKARFTLRGKDDIVTTLISDSAVNDGVWHHIVSVRDGNIGGTSENSLYVDGKFSDSLSAAQLPHNSL